MKYKNVAVGLDIGTTKVVIVVGTKNEYGKIEILSKGEVKSSGVSRGIVTNIGTVTQSIKQSIKKAKEDYDFNIKDVVVGIAGAHIRSDYHSDYINRDNPSSQIGERDVKQLKKQVYEFLALNPGEEVIHVLPQEYKVDSNVGIQHSELLGMHGKRLQANFHVIVGQTSSMANIVRCVKDATNLDTGNIDITLESLASSDSVLTKDEMEAGVALVDIGGGTTDLAIFKNGIICRTFIFAIGGTSITRDIKDACEVLPRQAESLKTDFGSAWPSDHLSNNIISVPGVSGRPHKKISRLTLSKIINARVTEIIEFIYNQIRQYQEANPNNKLNAGIVLTGGGAEIKDIRQLVEHITGMDTQIGRPNQHLAGESKKEFTSPIYATAIGLLKKGIEVNQRKQTEVVQESVVKKTIEQAKDADQQKSIAEGTRIKVWFQEKIVDRFKELLNNVE